MGVFGAPAEYRPNLIGVIVGKVIRMHEQKGEVKVGDIDAYEGTPGGDLKAYFPVCDRVQEAWIPEWLSDWPEWMPQVGPGL
jgi:tRNA (Thr-GGU) A37 N-methylase